MELPLWLIQVFGVYVIGTTVGFIWWMATITEKVRAIGELIKEIRDAGYAKKEDVDREFGKLQKDVDKAHSRIDEIQLKHT
jgi:hypothetical protein